GALNQWIDVVLQPAIGGGKFGRIGAVAGAVRAIVGIVLLVGNDVSVIRQRAAAQVGSKLRERDHLRCLCPAVGDVSVIGEGIVVLCVGIGVAAEPSGRGNALSVNLPTFPALVEVASDVI